MHENLCGSHDDLLISYDGLKLSHETSITKIIFCEPHWTLAQLLLKILYCRVQVIVDGDVP
jgi:hypothetical protein